MRSQPSRAAILSSNTPTVGFPIRESVGGSASWRDCGGMRRADVCAGKGECSVAIKYPERAHFRQLSVRRGLRRARCCQMRSWWSVGKDQQDVGRPCDVGSTRLVDRHCSSLGRRVNLLACVKLFGSCELGNLVSVRPRRVLGASRSVAELDAQRPSQLRTWQEHGGEAYPWRLVVVRYERKRREGRWGGGTRRRRRQVFEHAICSCAW